MTEVMRKASLLFIVLAFSACSLFPRTILTFDEAKLRAIPKLDVCQDYYTLSRNHQLGPIAQKQMEDVLISNGLSQAELTRAKDGQIFVGMSQCGLYAAWGPPRDEHQTVSGAGVNVQHVYGYDVRSRTYAYTSNGVVSGWQN